MNEHMKEFLAKASEDKALRAKLDTLAGLPKDEVAEKAASIAREAGFDLTAEDFHPASAELDASELEAVAGGGSKDPWWTWGCTCDFEGVGYVTGTGERCHCYVAGGGAGQDFHWPE